MIQDGLFGDEIEHPDTKAPDITVSKRVLITVTTAPNPSEKHGETVCVAGIEIGDTGPLAWVRLYPINLRYLRGDGDGFRKYNVVNVHCRPAKGDVRIESWNLDVSRIKVERHIDGWEKRASIVEPMATDTMCGLFADVKTNANARSLGLVRAAEVRALDLEVHQGWTEDEQRKIDAYVNQADLLDEDDKSPLEAPRLKGYYRYRCTATGCGGHRQQILDWEFVGFQRRARHLSLEELKDSLQRKFFDEVCAPDRDVAFYVGNLAKRHHTFSLLGIWWPRR